MADTTSNKYGLSPDQQYWWQFVEPALSTALAYTGQYTPEEQQSHKEWYATHVTPIFGPAPTKENPEPNIFTHDSSPCHLSINWTNKGKPTVRSGMTRAHNVFDSHSFVEELQPAIKTSYQPNTALFDDLSKTLFLTDAEEIAKVKSLVPPALHTRIPNIAIAWDLVGAKRKLKLYLNPQCKKLALGKTGNEIVISSIRALAKDGYDYKAATDLLEKYVMELNTEKLELIILGIDAADPSLPSTRLKPYGIAMQANSWNTVKNIYTIGGQVLDDERKRGLEILRGIWDLMRGHQGDPLPDDYDVPKSDPTSIRGVMEPSFEMTQGQAVPLVKIYLCHWQFAKTDRQIAECTVKIFRKLGWHEAADSYFDLLRDAFPYGDLDGPPSIHELMSFAYNDANGVYFTVYFSPAGRSMKLSGHVGKETTAQGTQFEHDYSSAVAKAG